MEDDEEFKKFLVEYSVQIKELLENRSTVFKVNNETILVSISENKFDYLQYYINQQHFGVEE